MSAKEAGSKRDNEGASAADERQSPAKKAKDHSCNGNEATAPRPKFQIHPYIFFKGNCKEAIDFYVGALDAEITMITTFKDAPPSDKWGAVDENMKDKIMHASIKFGDNAIMFSDSETASETSNIHLSISCGTAEVLDTTFARLSEGGKVTMPVAVQFWGARFGSLTDKFGVNWMLNCDP